MLRKILAGFGTSVVAAALVCAQGATPQQGAAGAGAPPQQGPAGAGAAGTQSGRAGGRAGGGGNYPTKEQWENMPASAKAWVAKATELAGTDPDLRFDQSIFCRADGGASNEARATVGVPGSEPKLTPYGAPSPKVSLGGQRLFDNFYWFGDTGVGAFLVTSNDGYILWDALNNEAEARDVLVPSMQKLGLDPAKIKYMVFGHFHGDHTGGGEYMQRMYHPKVIMGRDDWPLYMRSAGGFGGGGRGRGAAAAAGAPAPAPSVPAAPAKLMTHDIDAQDGMVIQVGSLKMTIYQMTGHTPGSIGAIVPVKWQGKDHPILIVTAGSDVPNRHSLIGGYEHIWDEGIQAKVESVMQVHPNTNMNILARTKYVSDAFPPKMNPLLYGPERTARYINIVRDCTLARMEILGW
jgi:metallo-beta-lactamase class B